MASAGSERSDDSVYSSLGSRSLPGSGSLLLIAGVLIDLLAAVLGGFHPSHHAGTGHVGHLVAMAGMAATLAGVVIDGARRQVRPRAADTQSKEISDAIR